MPNKPKNIHVGFNKFGTSTGMPAVLGAETMANVKKSQADTSSGSIASVGGAGDGIEKVMKSFGGLFKKSTDLEKEFQKLSKTVEKLNKGMGGAGAGGVGTGASTGAGGGGSMVGAFVKGNILYDVLMKALSVVKDITIGSVTNRWSQTFERAQIQSMGGTQWAPQRSPTGRMVSNPERAFAAAEFRSYYPSKIPEMQTTRPIDDIQKFLTTFGYKPEEVNQGLGALIKTGYRNVRENPYQGVVPFMAQQTLGIPLETSVGAIGAGMGAGLSSKATSGLYARALNLSQQFGGDRPVVLMEEMVKQLQKIAESGDKSSASITNLMAFLTSRGSTAEDASRIAQGMQSGILGGGFSVGLAKLASKYFPGQDLLSVSGLTQLAQKPDEELRASRFSEDTIKKVQQFRKSLGATDHADVATLLSSKTTEEVTSMLRKGGFKEEQIVGLLKQIGPEALGIAGKPTEYMKIGGGADKFIEDLGTASSTAATNIEDMGMAAKSIFDTFKSNLFEEKTPAEIKALWEKMKISIGASFIGSNGIGGTTGNIFNEAPGNFPVSTGTGKYRTDRHLNPVAHIYTKQWADILSQQGISISAGDPFSAGGKTYYTAKYPDVETAYKGSRTLMASDAGFFNWYKEHTGKAAFSKHNITSQSDFQKLDEQTQNAIIADIYKHEKGSGKLLPRSVNTPNFGEFNFQFLQKLDSIKHSVDRNTNQVQTGNTIMNNKFYLESQLTIPY